MKILSRLFDGALALALLGMGALMVFPGGPINNAVSAWNQERQTARVLNDEWPSIASGTSVLGNSENVQVVVFTDYECPFCRSSEEAVREFLRRDDSVGILVRHLPLTALHPSAAWAAAVAVCAERRGVFAAVHRLLMDGEAWRKDQSVRGLLETDLYGREGEHLEACLSSESVASRIEADRAMAESLHVTGTPTFATVDRVHRGGLESADQLVDLIRR